MTLFSRGLFSITLITTLTFSMQAQSIADADKNTKIERAIVEAMATFQVPGAAIAIVKDNKVIMSKGFGVIEHGKSAKVTKDTLFGIASNTKAMTVALLASLVDEGKLTWKTKVIDIIPEFQMPNAYVTREFTIIDLLAHNSGLGLGAGDLMIWPDTTLSNADIIKGIKHLPETSSFRSEFAYDNLLYIVGGEVISRITGQSWNDVVQARIFTPLGMNTTRAAFSLIEKSNNNIAKAHVPLKGELNVVGGNFIEKFGAAASVASSVNDMSLWLKAQLNKGTYVDETNGKSAQLFSAKQSRMMWQARTLLAVSEEETRQNKTHFSAYGLGWFMKDYQGVKLLHHGGGILGMVSKVVLVPEEGLGIVILTNQQSGDVTNAIYHQILNEYLDLPEKDWVAHYRNKRDEKLAREQKRLAVVANSVNKNATHSLALRDYAQTYVDNWYGEIAISFKNNQLHMQFGNTAELKGSLEHYQHNTFIVRWDDRTLEADAFVNFNLNEDGGINYVTMKAVSRATDFSFDFHDLKLVPKGK